MQKSDTGKRKIQTLESKNAGFLTKKSEKCMIYLRYITILPQNLYISSGIPHYSGWNQEIFDGFNTDDTKNAYRLAAYLHDGITRKNGLPYLTHINGSLAKFAQYRHFFGDIDTAKMQMLICLHDIAEDDDIGIELIEKEFGIDVLIEVLWMSIPKKRVRDGVNTLLSRKPEYRKQLTQFMPMYQSAATGKPTDDGFHDSLTFLLPGDWHNQWEDLYRDDYDAKESKGEYQRDTFAKYIFQGMVANMPEYPFLVKCIERLDNLMDREGLKDTERYGLSSYQRTVATTKNIYCKRLSQIWLGYGDIGLSLFASILAKESDIGIADIQRAVKVSTENTLGQATST